MRIWHALRTPSLRAVVGTSALTDLLVRLPDVAAPTLSLTGGVLGGPQIGFVTTWVVLFVAFYTFGPSALAHLEQLPVEDETFVALFALCGVGLGIVIQQLDTLGYIVILGLLGAVLCGGILLSYLVWRHEWQLDNPRGSAVGLLESITPRQDAQEEIASDLAYDGWLGVAGQTAFVGAVIMILAVVTFCTAIAAQILTFTFPLPDVLFLGWAISAHVLPQLKIGPTEDRVNNLDFDLEEFLIDNIELATRSIQGMFTTLFVLLGLFASGGSLVIVVRIVPGIVSLYGTALRDGVLGIPLAGVVVLWNWTGVLLLLLSGGILGFWVWIRELQRLPHFLDDWEGRFDNLLEPPPRVTGFLTLPIATLLISAWFLYFIDPLVVSWYTILWPMLIALAVVLMWHTNRRTAQPTSGEHIWIVSGLIAQVLAVWLSVNMRGLVGGSDTSASASSPVLVPALVAFLLLIIGAIPSVSRFERQYDDLRRYSLVGLLFVLGGLGSVGYRFAPTQYRTVSAAIALLCVGFGFLIGFVRYYRL